MPAGQRETVQARELPRFFEKWGVLPPPTSLVDTRDRKEILAERREKWILGTGRWGLIPVFPWTTDSEVRKAKRRIQGMMHKEHKDSQGERRRVEIAAWLAQHTDAKEQPIPWAKICRVVWGRKTGLRRPAVDHEQFPEKLENEWVEEYMRQGLSKSRAVRQAWRRARPSEAKASAQARKAVSRISKDTREILKDVREPRKLDPIGYALTMLFRAAFVTHNSSEARHWVTTLYDTIKTT